MTIAEVLQHTNWSLLREQKAALVELMTTDTTESSKSVEGLLNWIDALQDAASAEGYPVVFEEEPK